MLDTLPLWLVVLSTVLFFLLSVLAGVQFGLHRLSTVVGVSEGPIGSIVAALLALLAFILTFTFGMASSRFDARRELLLEEVNAIGTSALRAEMLTEPERTECLDLFRKYVDLRVDAIQRPATIIQALAASDSLQDQLWARAVSISNRMNSPIGALFITSLNQVIDLQTSRKTVALLYRIPGAIWVGLAVVTFLSMGSVGFQFGISGKPHWGLSLVLALTFSTVILLITVLDRPQQDILKVNQGAMIELQQKLHRTGS